MDRLIYTAVSGMSASMVRQRVIASNMANAQTIGFKAETLTFTPMTLKNAPEDDRSLEVRAMSSAQVRGASMREGSIVRTGRTLDLALGGDAMLAVQGLDGAEAYTRRGDLAVSATGVLQNGDGLPVIGENGPVTVPPGVEVSIAPDGAVMIFNPETPENPPAQVERLKLVSFTGSRLEKDLTGLFRVPGGGILPIDENAQVTVGALEQSNVRPTEILVEMVEAQRLFDMRTKLVSAARDLDQSGASLMRLNT